MEKNLKKWSISAAVPYVIATILPTLLLVGGFISGLYWSVIFLVLVVGVGLVDLKSMEIAGSSVNFDKDDSDNDEG